VQPPVESVEGRVVRELRRIGKGIAIGLDGDSRLVLHLMIAGRLHWRPPEAKLPKTLPHATRSGPIFLTFPAFAASMRMRLARAVS
jgi:formamidopyrimidine-DNA glycosylase